MKCKNCDGQVEEPEYVKACVCCHGELCGKCCSLIFGPGDRPTPAPLEEHAQ